jgi:oligopeptide/dipeptide ABC transporter ATP-binding protein
MQSIPHIEKDLDRLLAIPGNVPNPLNFPTGCKYNTRCQFATDKCRTDEPDIEEVEEGHHVACWHIDKLEEAKQEEDKSA